MFGLLWIAIHIAQKELGIFFPIFVHHLIFVFPFYSPVYATCGFFIQKGKSLIRLREKLHLYLIFFHPLLKKAIYKYKSGIYLMPRSVSILANTINW